MTLRQEYAHPRDRAIARHPDQPAHAAAPAHTGPADAYHRRPRAARAAGSLTTGPLPQVAAIGPVPVSVLWVSCRRSCVVRPARPS